MSFKGFLVNYFSPIFFILRFFLLLATFFIYFLLPFILHDGANIDFTLARYITTILALYTLYKALKPWRVGMTIRDIINITNK